MLVTWTPPHWDHQASIPQIAFPQKPSEPSECTGNLSKEGGWGFSAPYPTASSPSTHFPATVTFSFYCKPFLLQWRLFSLGSQPCSVGDLHPDLLHGLCCHKLCFLYWTSKQPRNPKPLSWQGSRQRLGRNMKCRRTHIHARVCVRARAHTESFMLHFIQEFKIRSLICSTILSFNDMTWEKLLYFPKSVSHIFILQGCHGNGSGAHRSHSTETSYLYYWTRLCA